MAKGNCDRAFGRGRLGRHARLSRAKAGRKWQKIEGHVLTSASLDTFWGELDAFEGEQYERVMTSCTLGTGERLAAFAYALR